MSESPKEIWSDPTWAYGYFWYVDRFNKAIKYTRSDHVDTLIAEAVAAEREACAAVVDELHDRSMDDWIDSGGGWPDMDSGAIRDEIVDAIRARTEAK